MAKKKVTNKTKNKALEMPKKKDYKKPKKGNKDKTPKEIREAGESIEWDDNGVKRFVPMDIGNRDCVTFLEVEYDKTINEILEDKSIEI